MKSVDDVTKVTSSRSTVLLQRNIMQESTVYRSIWREAEEEKTRAIANPAPIGNGTQIFGSLRNIP
ncbi:hypothetical protein [uncultured Nostoc sp.]|uniref:hypothetical protein n=1 Tax=uncultured Nostoc sp. TaxID=340711 RepID=UPI0035CA7D40